MHEGSFILNFTERAAAAEAAAEFSHLVELRDKSVSGNWLEAARADWKHADPPQADQRSVDYHLGLNCLQNNNPSGAFYYIGIAANHDDANAARSLGHMFENGEGTQRDLSHAELWYRRAVSEGNLLAQADIERVGNMLVQQVAEEQRQAAQAQLAPQRQESRQAAEDDSDRQEKISDLRADIETQQQNARDDESSANQVLNNCFGPGAAICQAIGQAGAARFRQEAVQARNQADADREEIQRLEGQDVQASQRRDTSYGSSLQQVATENGTSIQNAAAQQQANLQALAVAQQRQQAETRAHAVAAQNTRLVQTSAPSVRPNPTPSSTTTASSRTTAYSGSTPNSSINPYSSTSAAGSYNPYTDTGTGSIQTSCTDMTGLVQGTAKVGSDGWVSGSLTNNSNQTVHVFYTFKVNGAPSNNMANAGATTINPGQTVGGEGHGLYSTTADKNPGKIYWYAVLKSDHDQGKSCGNSHNW